MEQLVDSCALPVDYPLPVQNVFFSVINQRKIFGKQYLESVAKLPPSHLIRKQNLKFPLIALLSSLV